MPAHNKKRHFYSDFIDEFLMLCDTPLSGSSNCILYLISGGKNNSISSSLYQLEFLTVTIIGRLTIGLATMNRIKSWIFIFRFLPSFLIYIRSCRNDVIKPIFAINQHFKYIISSQCLSIYFST